MNVQFQSCYSNTKFVLASYPSHEPLTFLCHHTPGTSSKIIIELQPCCGLQHFSWHSTPKRQTSKILMPSHPCIGPLKFKCNSNPGMTLKISFGILPQPRPSNILIPFHHCIAPLNLIRNSNPIVALQMGFFYIPHLPQTSKIPPLHRSSNINMEFQRPSIYIGNPTPTTDL